MKWWSRIKASIRKSPFNAVYLAVSLVLIYIIGHVLFYYFGIFTLIGYLFVCIYNLHKIIEKPIRTVAWATGFAISAVAFYGFLTIFLPKTESRNLVSLVSAAIILYILYKIYMTSRRLKKY